jgi:hypothetical protein
MSLNKCALFAVVLAVVCIGPQAFAQNTMTTYTARVFVTMPADIQCYIVSGDNRFEAGNAPPPPPWGTENSVVLLSIQEVGCRIAGASNSVDKKIPLASTEVTNGMLRTKDFGEFKLGDGPDGVASGSTIRIAIRSDKLQSFRAFLQK